MLNDLKIKRLKPTDKMYRVADHSGLCLEIRTTGSKIWRYRYRHLNTAKMVTIGKYPEISLAYARAKTLEYREQLEKGIDPSEYKKNEKILAIQTKQETFQFVAEEYLEFKKSVKSAEWLSLRNRYLPKDIYPVLAKLPIKTITSLHIRTVLDNAIQRIQKSGRGTGATKGNLIRQIMCEVMQYAIMTSRIETDPTYALRGYLSRPDVQHAQPVDKEDIAKLLSAIPNSKSSQSVKNALKSAIYTMLRTIEIRRSKKEFIDFENRIWTIPLVSKADLDAGHRNMKKNRTHVIPLSNQMMMILKEQFALYPESSYIFPGTDRYSMIGKTTLNNTIKSMGLPHVTMHDFRATASTQLHEANFNSDWIELQLAHVKGDRTRASYDHAKWLDGRREMMQVWADMVDGWNK